MGRANRNRIHWVKFEPESAVGRELIIIFYQFIKLETYQERVEKLQ